MSDIKILIGLPCHTLAYASGIFAYLRVPSRTKFLKKVVLFFLKVREMMISDRVPPRTVAYLRVPTVDFADDWLVYDPHVRTGLPMAKPRSSKHGVIM